jgi:hypothetical protein
MNDFYKGNESFCPVREIKKGVISMQTIETIIVYNLVNSKGNKIKLELGSIIRPRSEYPDDSKDAGLRWRFIGKSIPMPVRSGTWFNGFPESVMIDWLKGNGWYHYTRVNMRTGDAYVYDPPKGNEDCDHTYEEDEQVFQKIIRELYNNSKRISAVRLCRYAHNCSFQEAYNTVTEIVDNHR